MFLATTTAAVTGLLSIGCGSQRTPAVDTNTVRSEVAATVSESSVIKILSYSLSDMSLVRQAALSGKGNDSTVEISLDRPANWGDGSFVGALSSLVKKTLPSLFEYSDVNKVVITIYGVDQGSKSDEIACRLVVDRATARNIVWPMLGPMTISSTVTEYYLHPKIQKNSYALGSGIPGH